MPKKPKKTPPEPEHYRLPHEIAEDAIGGPFFQPRPIRIRRPKPMKRRKTTTTTKRHSRTARKR